MPAKVVSTASLPGLSPVAGKPIVACFDGGRLSSDGGLLILREIEQRFGVAACLAKCIVDPRVPELVTHQIDEIVRFRMLMIAAGYENGNDADTLRHDPMFKLAMGRLPDDGAPCSCWRRRESAHKRRSRPAKRRLAASSPYRSVGVMNDGTAARLTD